LWMVLAEEGSRIGACRYGPDLHVRVGKQQPEQLSACITCCTCHCDPYSHPHDYATDNKVMHINISRRGAVVLCILCEWRGCTLQTGWVAPPCAAGWMNSWAEASA